MSRTRRRAVACSLWIAAVASAGPIAAGELDALSFLSGAWGDGERVVEYWLPPLRGLMVGINRAPDGDGMPFFEYLRIEEREDAVVYVASPEGGGTTEFRLTEVSATRAVFENPEHDFPQRIVYTRTGDRLEAEVGAERDGEWSSFTLRWVLMRCSAAAVADDAS